MSHHGKRALVVGAAGFIAATLIRELLARGAEVHGIVRPAANLWRLADVAQNITLHQADLADAETLDRVMGLVRPDHIYHLAVTRNASSREARVAVARVNVMGTLHLLEAAAHVGYERFVYAGSSLEYGPSNRPTRETDCPTPLSFFGATKAASTLLCQQAALAGGQPIAMLRLYSVYGSWEAPGRLIPTVMQAALGDRQVTLTEPGYSRDWIHVEDVVEALLRAAEADQAVGEIINIGTGQQWANEQVVEAIEAVAGCRLQVRRGAYPPRSTDTAFWVADIDKARRVLHWEPRFGLSAGIQKTFEWFTRHRQTYAEVAHLARWDHQ